MEDTSGSADEMQKDAAYRGDATGQRSDGGVGRTGPDL
jgi:hypothetical protein